MPDWVPPPEPYVGASDPIALRPETYARHARATEMVLGGNNARYPRPSRGRTTSASPGAWGLLASGHTVTAGSGTTLGSGNVKLCKRSGVVYPENETVTVYNAGAAVTAVGDKIVRLAWTVGDWALSCPGAAS